MERTRRIVVQRGQTCPLCRAALLGDCPECGAVYHAACVAELSGGGCSSPGCAHRPAPGAQDRAEAPRDDGVVALKFAAAPPLPGGERRSLRRGLPVPLAYPTTLTLVLLGITAGVGVGLLVGGPVGFWLAVGVSLVCLLGASGLLERLARR